MLSYCIKCEGDTLSEVGNGSQKAEDENSKVEEKIEHREEKHRRNLFGSVIRIAWTLKVT